MKKTGWTMAEMAIAIILLVLLSAIAASSFKPVMTKNKLYIYSAVKNLSQANIAVIEKHSKLDKEDLMPDDITDWFCAQIGDTLELDANPNCLRSASITDINLQFSNGITVQGLASEWKTPYAEAVQKFKNIVIDIDGPNSGPNKPWQDRFPLRIYTGNSRTQGMIMPVNCSNDEQIYDLTTNSMKTVVASAKSPYCASGKEYGGSAVTLNFSVDDQILTYDIYKAKSTEPHAKARLIASNLSPFEADCTAYGDNTGFYSQIECANANVRIHTECATKKGCNVCTSNNCPLDADDNVTSGATCQALVDADDIPCFTLLHKPSSGMPFFMKAIIGDIENGVL